MKLFRPIKMHYKIEKALFSEVKAFPKVEVTLKSEVILVVKAFKSIKINSKSIKSLKYGPFHGPWPVVRWIQINFVVVFILFKVLVPLIYGLRPFPSVLQSFSILWSICWCCWCCCCCCLFSILWWLCWEISEIFFSCPWIYSFLLALQAFIGSC